MRAYWELYKKDFRSMSFAMLVISLLILGWHFFLVYKKYQWGVALTFGLSFIPFAFFPIIALWMGFQSFRQEWKDDTIYGLLTLPRSGLVLTSTKLLVGMTCYIGVSILLSGLIFFSYQDFIEEGLQLIPYQMNRGLLIGYIVKAILVYWIIGAIIYIISQFSYLISKFYNKVSWLIVILVFNLSQYLIFRGGGILAPLFTWAPDISIGIENVRMGIFYSETLEIGTGPLLASLLIVIGIFFVGSWVLEKQLEV